MSSNIKALHACNFCGKNQTQVKTLIAGNNTYICSECIILCMDVIRPREEKEKSDVPEELTPVNIVAYLDQYVIGQTNAKKIISVAIYNHLKRINNPVVDGVTIDKSNILMIGNSGVGKSHMVRTLANVLNVPFAIVDATSLSQTGYVGLDPEECLVRLYQASENDIERAQKGIVFIDEADKIGRKSENVSTTRDVSGEGVQQALLKIIEGSDVKFSPAGGRKNPNGEFITMNTSNILFIVGGAFEGIEKIIDERTGKTVNPIGFASEIAEEDKSKSNPSAQAEDLIKFGLIPELVGRLPVITVFEDLDKDTLVKILTQPKNAIVKQFQKLFQLDGIQLDFTQDAYDAIAEKVINTKTGARGLRSVVEKALIDTQFELPSLKSNNIKGVKVTADTILNQTLPEKWS